MTEAGTIDWRAAWDDQASRATDFQATGRGSMDVVGFLYTVREIARILELTPGDRLLDIGCGTGIVALSLSGFVASIHAIDLSPAIVQRAAQNCGDVDNISVTVGTLTAPGVAEATFNKVLAYSVLQYLADEAEVLAAFEALDRILPAGGMALYAANPDPNRKQAYVDRIMDSDRSGMDKERSVAALEQTLWLAPERAVGLAREAGLLAEARPISSRIWQCFYMFDIVISKNG